MSDAQSTHTKTPSDASGNGARSRNVSETDNQFSTPSATRSKTESGTPTRPSSTLGSRQTNSTPRPRLRSAPIRPLSSPLGRSMSMRVSKKERRWSMRLEDPKSPVPSTYQDDYQSPEALSLRSLNLETMAEHGSELDLKSPTTYGQSYRWPQDKFSSAPTSSVKSNLSSKGDSNDTPKRSSSKKAPVYDHNANGLTNNNPVSPNRTASRNDPVLSQNSHAREETAASRSEAHTPFTRSLSFMKRNNSSGVNFSSRPVTLNGQTSTGANRKSSASSNEDNVPSIPSANGNRSSVNEVRSQTQRAQPQKLTNGAVRERSVFTPKVEEQTPRRIRAYQLQSSTGGSPFAYGSDSGTWV